MFDSVRDWIYSIENDALRVRCIEDLAELAAELRQEERRQENAAVRWDHIVNAGWRVAR